MSESIARKVQPFTIGTRLSVPAVSKCQDFTPNYLQSQSLDNCALQHNLNSLYLTHSQVCAHGPCLVSPIVKQVSSVKHQEDMAAEDHLNQNIASAAAVARSIKKITISGSKDRPENKTMKESTCVYVTGSTENNNNNNNVTSSEQSLPRIVGVSCVNKPNSQFKVLLRKENCDDHRPAQGQTKPKVSEEQTIPQTQISSLESQPQRKDIHPVAEAEVSPGVVSQSDCFTQRTSLFNQEALQAEAWIRGKLQDLKDGCNIQRCPLQDCEEASQTLQRDLKDFENTLIQLNQMGEQLICKMNPTSDLVKKQLSQLRDQWQTLKQTAANQTRALGGAKNLQEFNTKVDKLEAWIKEKEEEQTLVNVLGESVDKMQLTRRILDLKQDEQLYRNLYEEINHLALKLEKQGKTDGKNIASRRKHINKMYTWSFEMNWWIKVQSHLKNYHENLQLALEVSSFYHQADNILFAIQNMKKNITASKELDKLGDQEIRDIAGQIMMLDISVSQLSNLHPALADGVIQKQSEVKEFWAFLQKALRTDRPALPCTSSTFSREDGDPLTSSWEQCNVGTEMQRTMGKEVKEEQNRLKGYVGTADTGMGRTLSSQIQEQESANHHPSSPMGEVAVCANEAITRHQLKPESRKPRTEEKPAATAQPGPGHPPLHIQLQKFTVSADKTLSWLKDNVSMATQVCSIASFEGLDAARRCQHALEQEILNNRARIEVVKREGRGLVRAQHPGSARIQEFLGQLEVLWEELRRRHQRNALFLQASEELGFRVVKLLQALGSLDAWLESVELSMKESSLAGDPETMSMAERQSCLLEREVAARGHELSVLRQEVDRLHCHSHPLTQGLPVRMEEVENKYQRVQSALTQQSSELQDTRMLTEFLERVELEESLGQPLHSEMSPAPTLMDLQSSSAADPLIETMGDPVEELREAVEMLNNTVRERGRSQNHDQAIRELLSKHTSVAVRVEECLCRSKDLGLDILEKETDMAVQCEPDRCGLETLWEKQDHLEIDSEVIREEVKTVECQASRLQELCPERVHVFEPKIHATLQAWAELRASVKENKSRLQEFVQLQDFFRSYLQMISWTEDTRSCIFSDTTLHHGKDGQAPMAAELDLQIEQKFEEYEELAATGRDILDKEHHLSQMVKERMEELRSMLGWISVHWRAQKQHWLHKNIKQESVQDNVYSIMCSSFTEPTASEKKVNQSVYSPVPSSEEKRLLRETPDSSQMFNSTSKETEHGYEVMKSVPPQGPDIVTPESPKPSIFVLKDKSSPGLGNTVNLILSFGNSGDSQVQVLDTPVKDDDVQEETSESVCRVSTYLHVKDNNLASGPVYESITLPRQKSHSTTSTSPPPPSPSPPATAPLMAGVNFHSGSTSIFSSLKRIGKKRKRKTDVRRHTIQKIMGVEERAEEIPHRPSETIIYDTRTWPLKEGRKKKSKSPAHVPKAYVKNPLEQEIETECTGEYSINPYAVSKGPCPMPSSNQVKSHCRFLSLGSVLSFDLPKDMTVIPSIQDIITIAPPESKTANGADPDPHSQRQTAMSSFKQTRPMLVAAESVIEEKDMLNNDCTLKPLSPPILNNDQAGQCSNKLQVKCSSSISLNEDADQQVKSQSIQLPIYVNQPPTTTVHKHECLSVHTLIKDLNGHKYHKCVRAQNGQSQSSHMVVNLRSTVNVSVRQDSMDSGISSSGSVKHCSDESTKPKGVVGKLMSLDVGCITKSKETILVPSTSLPELVTDNVHVDHQQFEEEEEELEGIWSQNLRNSICSDIMYQNSQEDTTSINQSIEHVSHSPSPKTTPTLFRNLVTASAPNLLVAEFKLPSSVQSLLGYDKDQTPKHRLPPLAVGDRRSWAAFPNREASSVASVAVNETAADPVKLPEIMDNHRYIYHYREDEEEEEEAEVGEKEHTGASKDPLLNLQFVHTGLKSDQKQSKSSPISQDMDMQDETTGGHCITLCGKPELQTMEGILERKHRLQLGGKKAASRGWSSYHAVLYRHTLCFYQDRKETLRSSVCGLPLNLIGAECVPAPEYTKKPNSFHLRLRDGSEYLLNASSRFMMKKWIMKIQANTGHPEAVFLTSGIYRDKDPTYPLKPLYCSGCPGLTTCLCSSKHEVTSTFPRLKPRGVARASEITVLSREFSHMSHSHLGSVEEQQDASAEGGCDDDGDSLNPTVTQSLSGASTDRTSPLSPFSSGQDWLSSQRRSHSFTSATYQKICPVLSSPGGRGVEKGSNYCVTLLVGDKSRDVPSITHTQPSLTGGAGWQQDTTQESALRQYTSLPRPRNKSVFKKFFGKRD